MPFEFLDIDNNSSFLCDLFDYILEFINSMYFPKRRLMFSKCIVVYNLKFANNQDI